MNGVVEMLGLRAAALRHGSTLPVSVSALAAELGMSAPFSVSAVIRRLNQTFSFRVDSLHIDSQRAAADHGDSDFLSFVVSVDDQVFTMPADNALMGRNLHSGDALPFGDRFVMGPFNVRPESIVLIALVVMNLGDGDPTPGDQVEAIGKVTDEVAGAVGPFALTLMSAVPAVGGPAVFVVAVAGAIGAAMQFFGNLFSGPHCNGTVLKEGLQYTGQQLADLTPTGPHTFGKHYATETSPHDCGHPESELGFTILTR